MNVTKIDGHKPKYNTSHLLYQSIYPAIDAVAIGLLESLDPNKHRSHEQAAYSLKCPACHVKSAYYYPGSGMTICARENNCGVRTSLFDIVKSQHNLNNFEILQLLATHAGVSLDNDNHRSETSDTLQLVRAIKRCCFNFMRDSTEAMHYLRVERGFSDQDIKQLAFGYYPSEKHVRKALENDGVNLKLAVTWGLINKASDPSDHMCEKRIVAYWPQSDGSVRLIGRAMNKTATKKYLFCPGKSMEKAIPYRYRHPGKSVLLCVEGVMDAETLCLLGLPGCAIGGTAIIQSQAKHLVKQGIKSVMHITDGNSAGLLGALKTVRNCESVGIQTLIGITPQGLDDVDNLRKSGKTNTILEIINHAVTGGEFLARHLLMSLDATGSAQHQIFNEVHTLVPSLTPSSAASFFDITQRFGVVFPHSESAALRLAAELVSVGMSWNEINELVTKQYKLTISVQKENEGE